MKKKYKALIIFGALFITLLIIGNFYANSFLQNLVRKEINKIIVEQKDHYHIEVDDVNIQLFLKRFILTGVKVQTLDSIPIEYDSSFKIKLDRLIVKLDNVIDVFTEGKLKLKKIELDQPEIYYTYKAQKDSTAKSSNLSFKSKQLKKIQLSSFEINRGEFHLSEANNSEVKLITFVSGVDFKVDNLYLALNEEKIDKKISFKKILLDLGQVTYHDAQHHDVTMSNLRYSSKGSGIKIGEFELRNKETIESVQNDFSIKNPWVDLQLEDIVVKLNIQLLKEKELHFQNIELGKIDFRFYQNKNDTSNVNLKDLISNISIPISIDTFKVDKGKIDLSFAKANEEVDDYKLSKLYIDLNYLSNDSVYIHNNPIIYGKIKSSFWSKGKLEAQFNYDMLQSSSKASILISNFPERKLKKYTKGENSIHIKKGQIEYAKFDITSDSTHYEGEFDIRISELNVDYNHFQKNSKLKLVQAKLDQLIISSSFHKDANKPIDINLDSIFIKSPKITITERASIIEEETTEKENSEKKTEGNISINLLSVQNAAFNYTIEGQKQPKISIEDVSINEKSLVLDLSKKGVNKIISSGNYKIDIKHIDYFNAPSEYISLKSANIQKSKNKIDLIGLRYKNKSSKDNFHASAAEGNTWNSAYVEKVAIKADLNRLLKNELYCSDVKIVKPILTYIKAIDRKDKVEKKKKAKKKSDFNFPITIKSIKLIDGDIDFRVKKENENEFEVFDLSNLNGTFTNFILNPIEKGNNSKFSGKISAEFYNKGKLEVDVEHDFKVANGQTHIKGKGKNISMSILKDKVSVIKELNYSEGELKLIDFEIDVVNNNLSGSVLLGSMSVKDLKLGDKEYSDFMSFDFDRLAVKLSKNKGEVLHVSSMKLVSPHIYINHILDEDNSAQEKDKRSTIFSERGLFNPIVDIDKIEVDGGIIKQYDGKSTNNPLATIKDLNIIAKQLVVYDSTDASLPISIAGLDIGMNNVIIHSLPKLDINVESINFSSANNKIKLKNFEIKNKEDPDQFFSQLRYRKAWMDFTSPYLEIDFRFKDLFSSHPRISKVVLTEAIYTTIVNVGIEKSPDETPLPNRRLANSTFPFTIDSILVNDSQLNVKFKDKGTKHGLLQFNDVNASISNLSSDKGNIKKNNEMVWVFNSTIWETGITHAVVTYKLDTDNDEFNMYGSVDGLEMTDSDTLTSNLYGIKVNDGILYHTYFEFDGNNDNSKGIVKFDYENLHLSLDKKKKNAKSSEELKKVKKKDKLNESFVKNMIVNGFISKKNVPSEKSYIAYGNAYYEREKNKPIFHFMWYTISSGMIEIAEAGIIRYGRNFTSMFKKKEKDADNKVDEEIIKEENEDKVDAKTR